MLHVAGSDGLVLTDPEGQRDLDATARTQIGAWIADEDRGALRVAIAKDPATTVRSQEPTTDRPNERRRTVADDLYQRLVEKRESFWSAVYTLYMDREITRGTVREVIRQGLEESRGNYRILARLFNLETREYKRFLNFLRKHGLQLPFKEFR